jgi:hypothetical protein
MSEHENGDYIERQDPASLAAALLENIAKLKQQREDLMFSLKDLVKLVIEGQSAIDIGYRCEMSADLIGEIERAMRYER